MSEKNNVPNRREFLKTSGLIAGGAVLSAAMTSRVHAAEENTIKVALVGCGGRGNGAAVNALNTKDQGPVKLWALADTFQHRVDGSVQVATDQCGEEFVDVPSERRFVGLDSYKQAIDAIGPGGVVLLCTPPLFRPQHLAYAIEKNVHVFMEKSFCVDGIGYRKVKELAKVADQKRLKIAGGLMTRHNLSVEECIKRIHDGEIGDIITNWVYRVHGPFPCGPKGDLSPLHHQLQNFNCFNWLCGSFALDWMIHNLDISCWSKDSWPVSCQGMGGRQVRTVQDQMFDHCAYEYKFGDGGHLMVQLRQQENTWGFFGAVVQGTKGTAVLGEGVHFARIHKGRGWDAGKADSIVWQYSGKDFNQYQVEHDRLFAAIRADKPYNEASRCADASMVGILGRMATESGKEIFWNEVVNSDTPIIDGWDTFTLDGDSPLMPDENGNYAIAKPGITAPR